MTIYKIDLFEVNFKQSFKTSGDVLDIFVTEGDIPNMIVIV